LQQKGRLLELKIKCLEQEVDINNVIKRNVLLKEEKMKLQINILKKNLS
jgi:hypothetical protein